MKRGNSIKKETKDKKLSGQPRSLSKRQNRVIITQSKKSSCQLKTNLSKVSGFLSRIPTTKNPGSIRNHLLDKIQMRPRAIKTDKVDANKKKFNDAALLQYLAKYNKKLTIKNLLKKKKNGINKYKKVTSAIKTEYNKNTKKNNINSNKYKNTFNDEDDNKLTIIYSISEKEYRRVKIFGIH